MKKRSLIKSGLAFILAVALVMGVVPMPGIVTTSQAEVEGTPIYMEDGVLKIDGEAWAPTQVGQGDNGYQALVFPGSTYKLTSDITTEYPICLGEWYGDGWHDDNITLDLNGHSITGNGSGTVINIIGSEFTYSTLTLKDSSNGDGSITGGGMSNGGGVCVNGGIFVMDGGTISGNNGSYGGGVCVENTGSFTMNGGAINGNTASYDGGGVYVDSSGTFTMKGGTITGNTASDDGGGVFFDSSATKFSVSGNVRIIGNYKGTSEISRTTNNVYLEDTQNISFEGALNSNARIGVNTDSLRAFTEGLSGKGTASNFTSDSDNYEVVLNDSNEAELRKHTLSSLSVSIGGWTYEDTPNSPSISGNAGGGDVSYVYYTDEDCADEHKTTSEDGATVDGGRPEYAGNYWLKTTVSETDAYYGKTVTTSFTIAQKELPAPELDPDNPLIYNGSSQNLKDHLLNWDDDLMYFYENATGYMYSATDHSEADYMTRIDLTYPRNYVFDDGGDGTFYWNIEKATPSISNLIAGDITYGQKLENSTLNGTAKGVGGSALAGEFKWDNKNIKPSVSDSNTTAYNVTFTPGDSDNYETVSTTVKLKVNPKSVTITGLTATNRDYNPYDLTVQLTGGTVGGKVDGDDVTVDLSGATGTIEDSDAEEDKEVTVTGVKLGGTAAGNYSLSAQPTDVQVTINRIEWAAKTASGAAKYGQEGTVDLSALIAPGGSIGDVTYEDTNGVLDDSIDKSSITQYKLHFKFKNDSTKIGKTAMVQIPVEGATNHEDYNITATLTVTDKEVPTLTVNNINKVYDGLTVADSSITGTAKVGDTAVAGSWTFKDADASRKNITDNGVFTVVFTPSDTETYAGGETNLTLLIIRRPVTVKADNKSKTVGSADPTLTATVSGLVGSDTVTYVLSRAEGETVGSYTITPTGESGQGNYSVSYQTGTLTINTASSGGGSGSGGGGGGGSNPTPTSAPSPSAAPSPAPSTEPTTDPDKTPVPPVPTVDDTVPSVATPSAAPAGEPTVETKTGKDGTETETKTTTYTDGSTMTEEKITKPNGSVTEKTEVTAPDGSKESSEVTTTPDGTKTEKHETVNADGSETTSKEVVTEPNGAKTITESSEKTEGALKKTEETVQTVDADGKVTETVQKTTEENTKTGKRTEKEIIWDETGEVATTKTVETEKVGKTTVVDTVIENKDGSSLVSTVSTTNKGKETSRILETSATGNTTLTEQVKQPSGDYSKVTMNTRLKKDENGNVTGATVTIDAEQKTGKTTQKSSFVLLDTGSSAKKTTKKATLNALIKKAVAKKKTVALTKATTNAKNRTITIEKTVKSDGKTYTVTVLKKNLLKKNKKAPKKILIKATGITKIEKNAFKGIYKKATIKVKATKKQFKKIKKMIQKSGIPKKVKIKRV